jgi:hypothetical protein
MPETERVAANTCPRQAPTTFTQVSAAPSIVPHPHAPLVFMPSRNTLMRPRSLSPLHVPCRSLCSAVEVQRSSALCSAKWCRHWPPHQAIGCWSPRVLNDLEASRRSMRPHEHRVIHLPPPWAPPHEHPAFGHLWPCCHCPDLRRGGPIPRELLSSSTTKIWSTPQPSNRSPHPTAPRRWHASNS